MGEKEYMNVAIRRQGEGNTYRWACFTTSGNFFADGDFSVDYPDNYYSVMEEFLANIPQGWRANIIHIELDTRKDSERK